MTTLRPVYERRTTYPRRRYRMPKDPIIEFPNAIRLKPQPPLTRPYPRRMLAKDSSSDEPKSARRKAKADDVPSSTRRKAEE